MTPSYACTVCGAVGPERRCPRHGIAKRKATGWSSNRDRSEQRRFRSLVLGAAGFCCQGETETGERCSVTTDLRACHLRPLREFAVGDPAAYDAANGICLCAEHDRLTDRYAR